MTEPTNQDWQDLADSYAPAARALKISPQDLDLTLRIATRFERQCPSCRFSRAPRNALTQAERFGVLTIYERHCTNKPPQRECSGWEKLQPPVEVITDEAAP